MPQRPPRSSTTPAPPAQLLTVEEAGQLLRLTPATVRRYVARGALPGVRLGNRELRVDAAALARQLDAARVNP